MLHAALADLVFLAEFCGCAAGGSEPFDFGVAAAGRNIFCSGLWWAFYAQRLGEFEGRNVASALTVTAECALDPGVEMGGAIIAEVGAGPLAADDAGCGRFLFDWHGRSWLGVDRHALGAARLDDVLDVKREPALVDGEGRELGI